MEVKKIESIIGKVPVKVDGAVDEETMEIEFSDGSIARFWHEQDCCEHVRIADIVGDISDLVGKPLTMAEIVTNSDDAMGSTADSFTWTFYKFATIKGYVDVRWLGESNGYYSESVKHYVVGPKKITISHTNRWTMDSTHHIKGDFMIEYKDGELRLFMPKEKEDYEDEDDIPAEVEMKEVEWLCDSEIKTLTIALNRPLE